METEATAERKTINVVTLGASVRLVAIQFMMSNEQVPDGIPLKRPSAAPPMQRVTGVEVLKSTKDVDISPLVFRVDTNGDYQLVDAWKQPHATNWRMSVVRFIYCRNEFVRHDELYPNFVAKRDELATALASLVSDNLWTIQGHLNPYCESDGSRSGQDVLMLGCVGRKPVVETVTVVTGREDITSQLYTEDGEEVEGAVVTKTVDTIGYEERPIMVFAGGRDPVTNQGIGSKVPLSTLASKLRLAGDEVQLVKLR
ncbi:MAG: hypothetical protein HYT62_03810 [Candidatus Yanofskybacteria bacterium]|nr:hypothetical protein [Candidatus Yanofskybacteria bacterium]